MGVINKVYEGLLQGEANLVANLGKLVTPKVLVDVGANKGEYTRLLKDCYPEALVYSFDPLYGTCAVGNHEGTLELHVFENDVFTTGSKGWQKAITTPSKSVWVPVKRLDQLVPEEIDFLKIDVEGMELEVLEGLGEKRPKLIQFEYGLASNCSGAHLAIIGAFFQEWHYTIQQIDWWHTYGNWIAGPKELVQEAMRCIIQR